MIRQQCSAVTLSFSLLLLFLFVAGRKAKPSPSPSWERSYNSGGPFSLSSLTDCAPAAVITVVASRTLPRQREHVSLIVCPKHPPLEKIHSSPLPSTSSSSSFLLLTILPTFVTAAALIFYIFFSLSFSFSCSYSFFLSFFCASPHLAAILNRRLRLFVYLRRSWLFHSFHLITDRLSLRLERERTMREAQESLLLLLLSAIGSWIIFDSSQKLLSYSLQEARRPPPHYHPLAGPSAYQ